MNVRSLFTLAGRVGLWFGRARVTWASWNLLLRFPCEIYLTGGGWRSASKLYVQRGKGWPVPSVDETCPLTHHWWQGNAGWPLGEGIYWTWHLLKLNLAELGRGRGSGFSTNSVRCLIHYATPLKKIWPVRRKVGVIGTVTAPKDVHALIPRTREYVTLSVKRSFAAVIRLMILRPGDECGLSKWTQRNPRSL